MSDESNARFRRTLVSVMTVQVITLSPLAAAADVHALIDGPRPLS